MISLFEAKNDIRRISFELDIGNSDLPINYNLTLNPHIEQAPKSQSAVISLLTGRFPHTYCALHFFFVLLVKRPRIKVKLNRILPPSCLMVGRFCKLILKQMT